MEASAVARSLVISTFPGTKCKCLGEEGDGEPGFCSAYLDSEGVGGEYVPGEQEQDLAVGKWGDRETERQETGWWSLVRDGKLWCKMARVLGIFPRFLHMDGNPTQYSCGKTL